MVKKTVLALFAFLFIRHGIIDAQVAQVPDMSLEKRVAQLEELVQSQQKVISEQTSQLQALQSVVAEKKPGETVYLPTKEDLGKKVNAGYGKLTLGGLFQTHYFIDHEGEDTARIRRTELKFSGQMSDKLGWTVMIDPAQQREDNTRNSPLQDAYFTLGYIPHHKLNIGQFKIPISEEGLRSSAKLDTIERSFLARNFGDKRDVGAMITGDWDWLMYQTGVFNGQEQNNLDVNDKKDFAWRTVLRPFRLNEVPDEALENLELGMAQYYRNSNDASVFSEKRRLAYEARWERGRYSLKSEAAVGQTATAKLWGWYGQAGYYFVPDKFQGVFKFESYDPNERAANDRAHEATFGANYFLDSYHAKLQLNYVLRQGQDSLDDNQILAAMQIAY